MTIENMSQDFLQQNPSNFIEFLHKNQISKFCFCYDDNQQKLVAYPQLKELQNIADIFSNDTRDFQNHEGMFFKLEKEYDVLLGAFVHKTVRGQAAGGVRFMNYDNMDSYFRDGMRLAKGMCRKNALAGIYWGGGKGVILHNPKYDRNNPKIRHHIYSEYGKLMTSIKGCYVTAEDAGTCVDDMNDIFAHTKFTTCIHPRLGGSGNPSIPTARGIACGMEAALTFQNAENNTQCLEDDILKDKVIAIQGLGNVGRPLIRILLEKGAKQVFACDINSVLVDECQKEFDSSYPNKFSAQVTEKGDNSILFTDCDIVAPCAVGGVLNPRTIPLIKAPIICGAANNQLEDSEKDGKLLFDLRHEQGGIFVPDFLVNRMGIVNCCNENYGYIINDPMIEHHLNKTWTYSIHQSLLKVLRIEKNERKPSAQVAIEMADELSLVPHPIFGHRGKMIINSLVKEQWWLNEN